VGHILDADQAFYRLHSSNMHNLQFQTGYKEFQQMRATFDIFFREYNDLIPGCERLQKKADLALASAALWVVCHAINHREVAQTPIIELLKFAIFRNRGKFFDREYLRIYLGFSNRILRWVGEKLRLT
jgi:hypothetical protein